MQTELYPDEVFSEVFARPSTTEIDCDTGKGLRQRLLLTLEEFMERAKEIEEMAAADEPDPASAVSGEMV